MEVRDTEGRCVRNRDIPLLARIPAVMQDARAAERQMAWHSERRFSMSQRIDGMPRSGALPKGLDEALAMLDGLDREYAEKLKVYVREMRTAERILNRISSRSMRTFVVMRYVMGLSNQEIMRELNMTEWGFNRARRCVEEAPEMAAVDWRERYILDEPC